MLVEVVGRGDGCFGRLLISVCYQVTIDSGTASCQPYSARDPHPSESSSESASRAGFSPSSGIGAERRITRPSRSCTSGTRRWTNSYEADIHLAEFGKSTEPVCHTLTGYASGWCSSFFGQPLLAIEPTCRGRGDDVCRFEIKPVSAWGPEAEAWRQVLSDTNFSLTRELETKLVTIERQAAAIRELSTPVMEIWDDVLVLPIVGVVDTKRSMEIMDNLLQRIVETQSRCVIIDVTGVEVVDTKTADYLLKVVRASNLLGTRCVLTGLSPAIAQTLVEIGADLTEVRTLRNLKAGLKDCLRFLRRSRADAGED